MLGLNDHETLFVLSANLFQLILIAHFALRRWRFDLAMRFGPVVYAFGIPAAAVSVYQLQSGASWYLWLGGFVFLAWATYGYFVEYVRKIEWRNSLYWPVLGPYVTLYLATVMLYWWPLGLIYKVLWYGYAGFFMISTYLNITSHQKSKPTLKES